MKVRVSNVFCLYRCLFVGGNPNLTSFMLIGTPSFLLLYWFVTVKSVEEFEVVDEEWYDK